MMNIHLLRLSSHNLRMVATTALLVVFFGVILTLSEEAQAQRGTAVPKEILRTFDLNGTRYVVTCRERSGGKWIAGTGQKKRFTTFSTRIAELRKKITEAKKKAKAKLRARLVGLREVGTTAAAICTAAGDNPSNDDPNNPGPSPTPTPNPLPVELSLDKLSRPLTEDDVRWLLTRAAYGYNPRRHDYLFQLAAQGGVDAVVDDLLATKPEVAGLEARIFELLDGNLTAGTTRFNNYTLEGMRRAAITWAINTNNPLLHRLGMETFYGKWTVNERVFTQQAQYEIFWEYRRALLDFAMNSSATMTDLLVDISERPAMLLFLDNASNTQGVPNENYAREIQELYSMGTSRWKDDCSGKVPNYGEDFDGIRQFGDIFQATLALSGYAVFPRTIDGRVFYRSVFSEADHRPGPKVVYRGTPQERTIFKMRDLVDAIIAHPGAAQGLATDLLKAYVTPEPSCLMVTEFAKVIRAQNYNLRSAVSTLLRSNLFFNRQFANTIVKSPLQRTAQFANALGLTFTDSDLVGRAPEILAQEIGVSTSGLEDSFETQGMIVNSPATVFYYDEKTWLSSLTLAEHTNKLLDVISDLSSIRRLQGTVQGEGNSTTWLYLNWLRLPGDQIAADAVRFAAKNLHVQLSEDEVTQLAFYIQHAPNNSGGHDRTAWDNQTLNPFSFSGTRLRQLYAILAVHPKFILG